MTDHAATHVLALAGSRAIRQSVQTHADLLAALCEHPDVAVDCSGVTDADLSFVQIMIAAGRSAAASGHAFGLLHEPQGAVRAALERGGFACADAPPGTDPAGWAVREAGA